MIVPAAGTIEQASDEIQRAGESRLAAMQLAELLEFGATRAMALGASGLSKDFELGCRLGLAVARVVLSGRLRIIKAGLDPSDLL